MEKFNLRYWKPTTFIFICGFLALTLSAANKYILNHWGISVSIFAVIGFLLGIINSYLWNKKPFIWMFCVPDMSGRFEGKLDFEYVNHKSETISGSVKHLKEVVQNGSDIVINSWTIDKGGNKSFSTSIEASIQKKNDGTYRVIYNFQNEGNHELGFSPHYGTEVLNFIDNSEGKHFIGDYYTNRIPHQTKGKTDLKFISKELNKK